LFSFVFNNLQEPYLLDVYYLLFVCLYGSNEITRGFGHRFLLNRIVRLVLPIVPLASGLWVSEKDMQQD